MSAIEFKQLNKRYADGLPLTIHNANLQIEPGEFCVFVGPSGCGKSTLLRMVAGLEDISSGELWIDGQRVNDLPPAQRGVAMVFQSYALYPHMTVRENMAFGLRTLGANKAEIARKVQEAAESLQLVPLLDRLPKALSGGQRQRVAIGRAIVKQPKVFLFDEPLSNLDAALRVQTRLEIARLHKAIGTASMIYVTHDQVEAMTLADKIVLLHTGRLIEERGSIAQVGSPLTLYHRPASLFVAEFIGSPKMNILPGSLLGTEQVDGAAAAQVRVGEGLATQSLQVRANASGLALGQPVSVGVRPEHLRLAGADERANVLQGSLSHIERLGDSSLLYVEMSQGSPLLTVRVEGNSPLQPGDTVRVHAAATDLHLFDKDGLACPRTVDLPA